MADVAGMDYAELDVFDYENYQEGGGGGQNYAPPEEGIYWGTAPLITDEHFSFSKAGKLMVQIDPIEAQVPGRGEAYKVRFTKISSAKYQNRNASKMMDYLRACGLNVQPKSNEEMKQYIKMTSGKTFRFALQWESYNKDTQVSVKGQENFPVLADGTRQSWLPDEFDKEKKHYANGKVRYFISAVGGK